jgi:hypothetical protein
MMSVMVLAAACTTERPRGWGGTPPEQSGGAGGDNAGGAAGPGFPSTPDPGTGGSASGPPGGNGATGGAAGSEVPAGSGGAGAVAGAGMDASTSGGAAGRDASATAPDGQGASTDAAPVSVQGPIAEGRIVYTQDFETGLMGLTLSPSSLPASRVAIADDPRGMRGKVAKIVWMMGDNFRTSANAEPRSAMSSARVYQAAVGTTVSYAFGYMTAGPNIGATFAQMIRTAGNIWVLQGTTDGTLTIICPQCDGGNTAHGKLDPMRWYDFRVDMTYQNGGALSFFVDGVKIRESRLTLNDPPGTMARWDGGINNLAGSTTTRTVYFSNLSIAEK